MKVENRIGNGERDCEISMTRWQNVEAKGECLRSLDVGDRTSAEGARRSGNVECRRRHTRGRREVRRALNASISDPHAE
jgi:hypothetical protein